ncbi:hypothetical protein EIP73_00540 [Xylella fastidiosa subsp. pauca]|nr:hypothetical protein EIP73_00540 [Xylella fastidiosa subsp. pauca]
MTGWVIPWRRLITQVMNRFYAAAQPSVFIDARCARGSAWSGAAVFYSVLVTVHEVAGDWPGTGDLYCVVKGA